MKVVHMTSVHPPFDVRIFRRECMALAEHGYDTVLIAPNDGDVSDNGVTVRGISNQTGGRLKRMLMRPIEIFHRAIREDADVYHFHDPELLPVGLALRARGKRVIYDSHENLPRDVMHKQWIPSMLRR